MARIFQFRRGLKTNLPQLVEGELGFTTDTRELYIGAIVDGVPTNILINLPPPSFEGLVKNINSIEPDEFGVITLTADKINTTIDGEFSGTDIETILSNIQVALSTAYKLAGSLVASGIVSSLLKSENVGNVYNITEAFTTTADFLEGAGKTYPERTNIVVVEPAVGVYKFDIFSGFIDLSPYIKLPETGDGNKFLADDGSWKTVISGGGDANIQADWGQTDDTKDDYIKNKPTLPTFNITGDGNKFLADDGNYKVVQGGGGGNSVTKEDLFGTHSFNEEILLNLEATKFSSDYWNNSENNYDEDTENEDIIEDIIEFYNTVVNGETYIINDKSLTATVTSGGITFSDGIFSDYVRLILHNLYQCSIFSKDNLSETGLVIKGLVVIGTPGLVTKSDIIGGFQQGEELLKISPEDFESIDKESNEGCFYLEISEVKVSEINIQELVKLGDKYWINGAPYTAYSNYEDEDSISIVFDSADWDMSEFSGYVVSQGIFNSTEYLNIEDYTKTITETTPFIIYKAEKVYGILNKEDFLGTVKYVAYDSELINIDTQTFKDSVEVEMHDDKNRYYNRDGEYIYQGYSNYFIDGKYYLVNGKPLRYAQYSGEGTVYHIFGEYIFDDNATVIPVNGGLQLLDNSYEIPGYIRGGVNIVYIVTDEKTVLNKLVIRDTVIKQDTKQGPGLLNAGVPQGRVLSDGGHFIFNKTIQNTNFDISLRNISIWVGSEEAYNILEDDDQLSQTTLYFVIEEEAGPVA